MAACNALLAGLVCREHVHLVIGATPVAGARCVQSLAAGARPVLIAPREEDVEQQDVSTRREGEASMTRREEEEASIDGKKEGEASTNGREEKEASTNGKDDASHLPPSLASRIAAGTIRWLARPFDPNDLVHLGRPAVAHIVDAVFITSHPDAASIAHACHRLRIPVNVVDEPQLSSFSLLSVHADGPLQVGVSTNGRGCKLAARVRRHVAAGLPRGMGEACERLGGVRRRLIEERSRGMSGGRGEEGGGEGEERVGEERGGKEEERVARVGEERESLGGQDDSLEQDAQFNRLVLPADHVDSCTRKLRWLGQVCEYWPLERLAQLDVPEIEDLLAASPPPFTEASPTPRPQTSSTDSPTTLQASSIEPSPTPQPQTSSTEASTTTQASSTDSPSTPQASSFKASPQASSSKASPQASSKGPPTGRLILAGSGPGHPSLLTLATLNALVHANLVLADKLIPPPILALIPRRTPLHIARKFPGNADAAQAHLMALALSHVIAGRTVVRLKQGDPYLYGRGGEEVAAFAAHGLAHCVSVLPGLSSALVAPLYAAIPPTQRAVADQVLICTGTAQRGLPPPAPDFVASRTTVFLMALHRIHDLVAQLIAAAWPSDTPCAVIERATCPDQRIIRSRLAHVAAAIDAVGSRPPGLLVVGAACTALPHENDAVHEEFWSVEQGLNPADLALSIPLPWLNSTLPEPPAT